MYTRRDYLYKRCDHDQYYSQFITDSILALVEQRIGLDNILDSTDEWFNDIQLTRWDELAFYIKSLVNPQVLTEAEEGWSMSTGVCIGKQAAKMLREKHT